MRLLDFFTYYRKGTPHQDAAIAELEAAINKADPAILDRNAAWYKTWQAGGKQDDLSPALAIIKDFEGVSLRAYPDPLSGGEPWTIGYGTTRYQDGRSVKRGEQITLMEADLLLRQEIDVIASQLAKRVPYWAEMNANQKSALISFAYNLGTGFYGSSGFGTITTCLRDKRWNDVPAAMLLYRNPGSNVEAGLKRRRTAEGKLWAS